MNIGQVLELHLGMAARYLGIHIATPVFDGAREEDVWGTIEEAVWQMTRKQSCMTDVLVNHSITAYLLVSCI